MRSILTCLITSISIVSFGQTVKTMKPTIGTPNNYSKQEQTLWQTALEMNKKLGNGSLYYDQLSPAERALLDSLDNGYGPVSEGPHNSLANV